MVDFTNYKFRCSGLKNLMITPKKKGELLSETTKTYLRDIYIAEVYGRYRPDISSGAMQKGTMVETDSLVLIQHVTGQVFFKNNKHFENEFIKGTPDVVPKDEVVRDVKSSFNIFTFSAVDAAKAEGDYFWQIRGYGWLTGKKSGELMYALVNTPESVIENDRYKMAVGRSRLGDESLINEEPEAIAEFRKNYIFDDIPELVRLKVFHFDFDDESIENLKERIVAARQYLATLSL